MSHRPLSRPRPLYITCDHGAERALARELKRLGASEVNPAHRGVYCVGADEVIWRINIYSRLANRVLIPIAEFNAENKEALYGGVKRIRWDWWIHSQQTLAVDASSTASTMEHTHFISQVVKDGVVDAFRERFDERPSVDTESPDLPINARIFEDICTLSLDASGPRLHRRGYRVEAGRAPLKETLASLLNHLIEWRPHEAMIDLSCGSGTLLIEAGLRASLIPPGQARAEREGFAFQRWRSHSSSRFNEWMERAPKPAPIPTALWGSDIHEKSIERARRNAARAGVADLCVWSRADALTQAQSAREWVDLQRASLSAPAESSLPRADHSPPLSKEGRDGVILMNPPYGERLSDPIELISFYRALGAQLKTHFAGFEAWLLVGDETPWREIGLKPGTRYALRNGSIPCHLVQFKLFST